MFRISRAKPWPPQIDLATLRETLAYMHDDMVRAPGMEKLRDALALAMHEAEAAERRSRPPVSINQSPFTARFLPRRA